MNFDETTLLSEMVTAHPQLSERLPSYHDSFKILQTPLAPMLSRKLTVSDLSRKTGIAVPDMLTAIQQMIE